MTSSSSKTSSDRKLPKVRIMVFGTFDGLHKGHHHLLKQARALAKGGRAFLIVSVARDKNVKRIKGRKPKRSEKQRLQDIQKLPAVNLALLSAVGNHIPHIVKQRPDIIALGYDQTHYVDGLRQALQDQGLKVKVRRLRAFKPKLYKSSLIKQRV